MSETLTMTRGQLADPTVKAVIKTPDTIYVVVRHVAKEGELSDSELENVAGGHATYNIPTAQSS
jgi:hypothetical protein